jgi:hypothetical protein
MNYTTLCDTISKFELINYEDTNEYIGKVNINKNTLVDKLMTHTNLCLCILHQNRTIYNRDYYLASVVNCYTNITTLKKFI